MKTYILLSEKTWHIPLFKGLCKYYTNENWQHINNGSQFNITNLNKINPNIIFIPHWSEKINKEIYTKYKCIVFHMTDLPYGRGGSPLHNLIICGHKSTVISAIDVVDEIDAGNVYLKKPLSLKGTAHEIFIRSSGIIKQMIIEIIDKKPEPQPQEGEIVKFTRRTPEDGSIEKLNDIEKVYDYIRMLDVEGYPSAFIETANWKFEFSKAQYYQNEIEAHVRITKK